MIHVKLAHLASPALWGKSSSSVHAQTHLFFFLFFFEGWKIQVGSVLAVGCCMSATSMSPRREGSNTASPRSPKSQGQSDDWTVSSKISSLSYGELKAIAYRHPGLIYNPHLTEKIRLFLAMELGLQRMALDTIATLRVSPHEASDEGVSILHLTCAKGFPKILSLLQERKTDLETPNDRGETPLFVAAQAGHAEIVERLIQAGCKVNTPNAHGISALQVAALSGHLDVVQVHFPLPFPFSAHVL